ncbi:hypothetical protein VTO42DRAFT_3569 [Malbranchea cinnamomea]
MSLITETEGDLFDVPDGAVLIHACNCQGSWGKGIAEAFKTTYPAAFRIYRAHCKEHLSPKNQSQNQNPYQGTAAAGNASIVTKNAEFTATTRYPEGTALIIPPQPEDYSRDQSSVASTQGSAVRGRGSREGRGRGSGSARVCYVSPGRESVSRPEGESGQIPSLGQRASPSTAGQKRRKHWIACLFTSWHYGLRNRSPPDVVLRNTASALEDLKAQLEGLRLRGEERESGANAQRDDVPRELFACRFNAGLFAVPWRQTKEVLEKSGLKVTVVRPPGEPL